MLLKQQFMSLIDCLHLCCPIFPHIPNYLLAHHHTQILRYLDVYVILGSSHTLQINLMLVLTKVSFLVIAKLTKVTFVLILLIQKILSHDMLFLMNRFSHSPIYTLRSPVFHPIIHPHLPLFTYLLPHGFKTVPLLIHHNLLSPSNHLTQPPNLLILLQLHPTHFYPLLSPQIQIIP